jgi:aspartyl-tRNA(Asn)/glutamyl-tRNA(Gln) amidotransferase subunit A
MTELAAFTLAEIAADIRARKVSSLEATRVLLARIERWQPTINAFVRLHEEEALAAAATADTALARGNAKGALHGVPLAHKDMFYVAGKLAECGSRLRKGFVAGATSTAVARLDKAGSVRLGALHMSEFAYGPTGHNAHLGPARNPWDPTRITGGSSSGSGAAVAARLVYAALGSDTGGSIRLPAHFCGVTGLKPTYGRVSRANAMPLSFSLDSVGPLARTAEDCALILAEIAGPDALDATTVHAPLWDSRKTERPPSDFTIGIPSAFYTEDLDVEVAATFDNALSTLRELGVKLVSITLPDQSAINAAALVVLAVEATSAHAPWLRTRADDYGPQVRARLENGLAYSGVEYLEALRWRAPALAEHLAAIGNVDAIIAPVANAAAPTIAETDVGAGAGAELAIQKITRFMRLANYLGLPSLAIPAGSSKANLPIGIQLIGRPFGDETLIALGRAFQAATDYHRKSPELPESGVRA